MLSVTTISSIVTVFSYLYYGYIGFRPSSMGRSRFTNYDDSLLVNYFELLNFVISLLDAGIYTWLRSRLEVCFAAWVAGSTGVVPWGLKGWGSLAFWMEAGITVFPYGVTRFVSIRSSVGVISSVGWFGANVKTILGIFRLYWPICWAAMSLLSYGESGI